MSLFTTRRFLPLFVTQFLGALNDNLLKNAMLILVTYRLVTGKEQAQMLVTLAGGLFILPFFLFSATAGTLADGLARDRIARTVKIAEIGIMALACLGFATESIPILFLALIAMGVHSTFFGTVKYSLIPQHLEKHEVIAGNGYVEAGTFLAILVGTITGGLLVLSHHGILRTCLLLIGLSICGYTASRFIPPAPPPNPALRLKLNIFRETASVLRESRRNRRVFRSILGISWFWLMGAAFLSQFPVFTRDVLSGDETVVTLLLTVFALGIGLGSVLCNHLLRGQVQTTYVPIAALGMSAFMIDLYVTSRGLTVQPLRGAGAFLQAEGSLRLLGDLLMIALSGGIFTVPLYALMQTESAPESRAQVIAANNVLNALFMVSSAVIILMLARFGLTIPRIFLTLGLLNLGVAVYICLLLPDALIRSLGRAVLRLAYRVKIDGLRNYSEAGERVLLIANHTSLLDAALIAAFLPEKITFAVNTHIARRWWMKPLLMLVDAFPLDPTNPLATKSLIDALKAGRKVMIFPEGRITVTGALMKVYEGPGMIADKAGAMILPIRIDGAQYSPFSYLKGKVRQRWFPTIRLTVLPPRCFELPEDSKGRARRRHASAQLYELMATMMFETSPIRRTLFSALLDARQIHGADHVIAEDVERRPLTYRQFAARSLTLGRALIRQGEPATGVLLPTSVGMALTIFGLIGHGRTPALLNFSAGSGALVSACHTACLTRVVTSRRFIAQARLEASTAALEEAGIALVYLEDVQRGIGLGGRLYGALASVLPGLLHRIAARRVTPDDPALILFTSGSEGTPKGVVLSHANFLANAWQVAAVIDFGPTDIVFNCLPMFHAFGLTGGTLLPLLAGIRCFFYPSPLHYRIVPELIYDTNATILFGTDTFLAGYARTANPYDLHSVRYIFAGAERLRDETRMRYMEAFGQRVYEGYGATETAPVISINTPMFHRAGSVGRLLPGIATRLEPVPGIAEGGQLFVKGPNIMRGYFKADSPGVLQPLADGWYDTGDIVSVDDDGFLRILGRVKRFAKIAGEMVSLATVEAAAQAAWPDAQHAAIALPDEAKGERIVLATTQANPSRGELQQAFREQRLPEIALPKTIIFVEAIPLLGTGKTDYVRLKEMLSGN